MDRKWHDIIMVYCYEIIIPGDVDTYEYITNLMKLKTDNFFRVYTLVCSVSNKWEDNQVVADDVFPIVGFEISNPNECFSERQELDEFLNDNLIFEGYKSYDDPKLFSGIDVHAIQP